MIIDRYMIREVGMPFLGVTLVLAAIFATYSLTRYLVDANAGLLLPGEVVQLTALRALVSLEVLLPLSFYLAVMIGMGRLYSDSEIYAMRSGGVSERRLMLPIMLLALLLAAVTGSLSLLVRPWAYTASYQLRAAAEASSEVDRLRPGRFQQFADSGRTVFIERPGSDRQSVNGIFVHSRNGDDISVITAANGRLEHHALPGQHRLTLYDARIFKRVADGPDLVARLGSFALWLSVREPEPIGYRTKATSSLDLEASRLGPDRAELQWRVSTPISALLLALLAIPLSRSRPRQGRFARVIMALGIYAVYFTLLDVSRTWVEQGSARSIWWVPGLLLAVLVPLYVPWHRRLRRPGPAAGRRR